MKTLESLDRLDRLPRRPSRSFTLRAGLLALVAAALLAASAHAVVLDDDNRRDLVLQDGTTLVLFGEAIPLSEARSNKYYYLPTGLKLSRRPDTTPEFLFLKFTTDQRVEQGGLSGALLHFLVEWGLTPAQEQEAKAKLEALAPGAQLMGAAPVETDGDTGTFRVISATLSDGKLSSSTVLSDRAPVLPNARAAVASRLSAEGAQLLAATFERTRSITDLSLQLNLAYSTLTPAAKGYVEFNWERIESERDSLRAEYSRRVSGTRKTTFLGITVSSEPLYAYSYDEMREQYKFLQEKKIVDFHFDQTVPGEQTDKVREAFFQYFLDAMGEPAGDDAPPPPPADGAADATPDIRTGTHYTYNKTSIKNAVSRKHQRFDLNYRLAIRRPLSLVGNLASWYDGVRDNPKCVASIPLGDPFFEHRDIHFILDLDAKDIFDEAINYVTVNVRKKRNGSAPFEDRMTIDKAYVQSKGIAASTTYARGEDTNADVYEYKAQWSLRGGRVFPATVDWQKGDWQSVTLQAPVVPRTIEVEADLPALQASDITRVTAQIRYSKFGEEAEENIQISTAKGESLVAKKIFLDRGAKGYAYRLVINHKTEGKLALPWSAQVGDDYIYAAIPANLLMEAEVKAAAKEAAKTAVAGGTDKVLDQFRELVGGNGR